MQLQASALIICSIFLVGCGTAPLSHAFHLLPAGTPETAGLLRPSSPKAEIKDTLRRGGPPSQTYREERKCWATFGLGFVPEPSTPILSGTLHLRLDEQVSMGPTLQGLYDDNTGLFAGFWHVRYWFVGLEEYRSKFRPYLQAGIGANYLDIDGRGHDWAPLLNAGVGLEINTGDKYQISSTVLYNVLTSDSLGESSYVSWEVVSVRLSF